MRRAHGYRPKCLTCERSRRPYDLMCSRCWGLVPEELQQEIYRTAVRGSIRQSAAWTDAVDKAVIIVEAALKPKPEEGSE